MVVQRTVAEWECLNCNKIERQVQSRLGGIGHLPYGWLEIYDGLVRLNLCSFECAVEVLQSWIKNRPVERGDDD